MARYLNRRRVLWALLVLLSLIVACGPGEMCETESDKSSRESNERMQQQFLMASQPPSVSRIEAKLAVPVTTYTVTASYPGVAPLTYGWTLTGEQCGTPAAPWRQSGVSVAWSHSDQKPDSCEHKGTNHAVVAKVVVTTPTWLVTCTIDGSENKVIDYPKCEQALNTAPAPGAASATPTRTPAR